MTKIAGKGELKVLVAGIGMFPDHPDECTLFTNH